MPEISVSMEVAPAGHSWRSVKSVAQLRSHEEMGGRPPVGAQRPHVLPPKDAEAMHHTETTHRTAQEPELLPPQEPAAAESARSNDEIRTRRAVHGAYLNNLRGNPRNGRDDHPSQCFSDGIPLRNPHLIQRGINGLPWHTHTGEPTAGTKKGTPCGRV